MTTAEKALRILVVDDDEDIRLTLREVLMDRGFRVDTARDDLACTLAIQTGVYDVVLLDLNLGGERSGIDIVRDLIRAGVVVPSCVILTASAPEAVNRLLENDHVLTNILFPRGLRIVFKPPTTKELLDAIAEVTAA